MSPQLDRDVEMYDHRSDTSNVDALSNLTYQLDNIARRCGATGLHVHQIHASRHRIEALQAVFGWGAGDDYKLGGHSDIQLLFVHVQRLMRQKAQRYVGPSVVRWDEHFVLEYVAQQGADTVLSLLVVLPDIAAAAVACSAGIDQLLTETTPTIELEFTALSRRELEVARWISEGKTSHEAALILGISEHTVNEYIRSGMRKMGATNRLSFVAKTIRLGLVA